MVKKELTFGDLQVNDIFKDAHGNVWKKIRPTQIPMGNRNISRNAIAIVSTIVGVKEGNMALFSDITIVIPYAELSTTPPDK